MTLRPTVLARAAAATLAGLVLATAVPTADAAVTSSGAQGFAVHHELSYPGDANAAWARLVDPARWWSSAHTYSQSAKNLSLAAVPGGCWCETLPGGGFVRHMDVLIAWPARMLRLGGGLGPLQGMGVSGALTFVLRADGDTTRIVVDYVVAGYSPGGFESIAKAVDGVLAEQLATLGKP